MFHSKTEIKCDFNSFSRLYLTVYSFYMICIWCAVIFLKHYIFYNFVLLENFFLLFMQ